MKTALVVMAMLVGCAVDDETPDAVVACRASAARSCDAIGYGGNATCLLVFAADCSPEDESAAHAACVAASGLTTTDACVLQWR